MTAQRNLVRIISALHPWQISALCIVLTELVVSGMSLLLRGYVAPDYLITGFVAALIVCYSVIQILFVNRSELADRVAERTAGLALANILLENQIESSPDAILVVDAKGRMASFNRKFLDMWSIAPEIARSRDDNAALASVLGQLKDPEKFLAGVRHLYEHPEETVRDEIELKDGRVLDRYSSGMRDVANKYLGRIWFFRDITERKLAEGQLRQFRALVEASTEFIAMADLQGRMIYLNPAGYKLLGLGGQEVASKIIADFVMDEDKARVEEDILPTMLRDGFWHGEFSLRHFVTGAPVSVDQHAFVIADPRTGKPIALANISHDITARKETERALAQQRTQLRDILDNSPVVVYLKSTDGKYLLTNTRFEELFNLTREEILGKTDHDIFPKDFADAFRANDLAVVASGKAVELEEPAPHADGVHDYISVKFPLRDPENRIYGICGISTDITERKRAEDQLRKLSLAVEQSSNIILITNTDGVIEYVNPKFTEVTGYGAGEIIGRTPAVLGAHLTGKQKYERFWETLMAGREWHGEFLNRKKNGELFWCEEHIAPIHDAGGKVTHFVAVETDITERRKTAEQLQQAQKMETVGRLAGGIAHDFNNLLMVIQGNLELLLEKLPGRSEAQDFVDRALHATGRSAELVNQLLLFSRRQFLQPQAVDVGALIGRMTGLLDSMVMETISVSVSVPDDLWHAFVDPAQLENALLNLALNARDAMPKGGTLSMTAENVELASNDLPAGSGVAPGSFVRIAVADTGTGMPPEVLQRVFEPFFTTKEVGKGSGLGLSMVYGFVKQSGGHVEIDSAPGRGTRVDLYLRKTEPERMAEAPKGEVRADDGGQTILVVEDNPDVREIAAGRLKKLGYRVIETASGPAALAVLESNQTIALLFTDIVVPGGMSGVELARRARDLRPGIKLLFATGYAEEAVPGASAQVTDGEILTKPYRKDDLARAIRDALRAPARR